MTVSGRFSLDTNILVYAVDRDAGERRRRARELVRRAARQDCVLALQALAEFFHATVCKNLLSPARASAFVRDWCDVFQVVRADSAAFTEAMNAVEEHRLSFWDAMLWATIRRSNCSALLSEDMQDGRHLGGVEIIDPFAPGAEARLQLLLAE